VEVEPRLAVRGLRVEVGQTGTDIVSDVSFDVLRGTALAVVGESGCGKTTVAMALLGHARSGTRISAGSVVVEGIDLLARSEREVRALRGNLISFVPQNPSKALSPGVRIGRQILELLETHRPEATDHEEQVEAALADAQLPASRELLRRYPHQLSGGQQQRVAIAMALVCRPAVIVMDEPTTGIDVITQARLLDVVRAIRAHRETSIVYVSHDLRVVRNLVDRVAVMYGGEIVEEGRVEPIFEQPLHPYTRRLLEAIPRVARRSELLRGIPGSAVEPWNRPVGCTFAPRCEFREIACDAARPALEPVGDAGTVVRCRRARELMTGATRVRDAVAVASVAPTNGHAHAPVLAVEELVAGYGSGRRAARPAVDGVSLSVAAGACLALVGESGSGKTTLARCIAGLHRPSTGRILFEDVALAPTARERRPDVRRRIQIVFQDPDSSLNPSMSIGTIIGRPLRQFFGLRGRDAGRRVAELLERVHLPAAAANRRPRELSGGEKQRVALARALAAEPTLLICDEVTSALDVAVQASILDLLRELRASTEMTMLFVSHDLAVVRTVSDDVAVMRDGTLRERAATEAVFTAPEDEYSRALLAAVPDLRETDY
jgi:peptide/nickel transport system ATP-binding protein